MAMTLDTERPRRNIEELNSSQSPGADYGLKDDYDPAKYEFYNPGSRKARQALAVRLEE